MQPGQENQDKGWIDQVLVNRYMKFRNESKQEEIEKTQNNYLVELSHCNAVFCRNELSHSFSLQYLVYLIKFGLIFALTLTYRENV